MMFRKTARRVGSVVLAIGLILGLDGGAAMASTNPGPVNSTYYFASSFAGSTQFTVYGTSGVTLVLQGNSGPSEVASMHIEIQTCGSFGCHWNGLQVGTTCSRTLYVGGYASCHWLVPASNTLHRIVFSKATDGSWIGGTADIS
jgi:hypothetical protein